MKADRRIELIMSFALERIKIAPATNLKDAVKEVKDALKDAEKVECPEETK